MIPKIPSSEITPKQAYLSRREFIKAAGVLAGSMVLAGCAPESSLPVNQEATPANPADAKKMDELGSPVNSFKDITNYNNFYEFTTDKEGVAPAAAGFQTSPWEIEVGGMVKNAAKFSVDDWVKKYQPEERIYRLRCVEAWSMVIPWVGFPLWKVLKEAEPTSDAKYVRFISLLDPERLPGQKEPWYPWPYEEGLRLDEAMNDLAILATGLYGGELPAQNGGGIRLVVPWKYGFKSIKSVVKIELTDQQPKTLWNQTAPNEYGFYSNVNPQVDHPRWSQATERRIGELGRRDTLLFNGYAEQVASLYADMDLRANY